MPWTILCTPCNTEKIIGIYESIWITCTANVNVECTALYVVQLYGGTTRMYYCAYIIQNVFYTLGPLIVPLLFGNMWQQLPLVLFTRPIGNIYPTADPLLLTSFVTHYYMYPHMSYQPVCKHLLSCTYVPLMSLFHFFGNTLHWLCTHSLTIE